MKLDFFKNTKRNALAAYANSLLGLLLPFLNRSLFLWLMGPQYLGLNGLFGSILGMLSLAELGFGAAVVYSMYKPIAEDNKPLVCAYLRFYRTVYRCVGAVIFLAGLCLMPFLRRLIHGEIPPELNLHLLFLIHLVNTASSYFFFAYRGSILAAHHRNDVLSNIRSLVSMAQYATVFLILWLTRNYYHYILATVFFTLLSNLLILKESHRLYPDIEPKGALEKNLRWKVAKNVCDLFMHKIGAVITYSINNVIISAFLGLTAVAAYGNYFYVYKSIAGLISSLYTSMKAGFGNRIHTESQEENFALFMKAHRLIAVAIVWCAAMLFALYQPFIQIWTRHKPELGRHFLTAALMVLFFLINQSRQVLLTIKDAAGLWHKDRWKPLVAGLLNLSINITLIRILPFDYKLDGVITATIVSLVLVQIPWETYAVFSTLFTKAQARTYLFSQIRFALLAVPLCAVTWFAVQQVTMDKMQGMALKGVVAGLVSGSIILILFRHEVMTHLRQRLSKGGATE